MPQLDEQHHILTLPLWEKYHFPDVTLAPPATVVSIHVNPEKRIQYRLYRLVMIIGSQDIDVVVAFPVRTG
jgi:hypothetical protein